MKLSHHITAFFIGAVVLAVIIGAVALIANLPPPIGRLAAAGILLGIASYMVGGLVYLFMTENKDET